MPRRARGSHARSTARSRRRKSHARSIAGTIRSSSGPSPRPVSARRIGWNSALPFWPVRSLTRPAAARNASLSRSRAVRELLGERVHHGPCAGAGALLADVASASAAAASKANRAQPVGHLREAVNRRRRQRHQVASHAPAAVGWRVAVAMPASTSTARRDRPADPARRLEILAVHPGQLLLVEDARAVTDRRQVEAARQLVERQHSVALAPATTRAARDSSPATRGGSPCGGTPQPTSPRAASRAARDRDRAPATGARSAAASSRTPRRAGSAVACSRCDPRRGPRA